MEDQGARFDGEVERLSRQVVTLAVEKVGLEEHVKQQGEQMETNGSRKKILKEDMDWVL